MSSCQAGQRHFRWLWLALALVACLGCRRPEPPATVEGSLRRKGIPLDDCLVSFFPESGGDAAWSHATGLTDEQGRFQLRNSNQQAGTAIGWHRVTIQDMAVSRGVARRDHGTVDQDKTEERPPALRQRSRLPDAYLSLRDTPLSHEVAPGHQVIVLDIP
jgi:hypothetical protein